MNLVDNIRVKLHLSTDEIIVLDSKNFLASLELLKELDSEAEAYSASPSSNSLVFGVYYDSTSPFYNKLGVGLKVEIYTQDIVLGTFYITSYELPNEESSSIATITAYDLFYNLINTDIVPDFEILEGIDVKTYITQVFFSVGIPNSKIKIYDGVFGILNYSICFGKVLAEILKEFCLATDTFIFVNNLEEICVIPKIQKPTKTVGILNDDILYSLDLSCSYKETITGLQLNYSRLTIGEQEEILKIETTLQPDIQTELLNNQVKNPLYILDTIKVEGCLSYISSITANQNLLSLYLTSQESEEKRAIITVLGKYINLVESFVLRKEEIGNSSILDVKSQLIQDTKTANILIDKLFLRLNSRVITASLLPETLDIELGKIFKVSSHAKNFNALYMYVHSFKLSIVEGDIDLQLTLKEIKGVEKNAI